MKLSLQAARVRNCEVSESRSRIWTKRTSEPDLYCAYDMAMQNIFNKAKSEGLKIAEYFTPTLKDSKFAETGVVRYIEAENK